MPERDQRYEYIVEDGAMTLTSGTIQEIIDRRANEGYRLFDIVKQNQTVTLIFERPVED